MKRLMVLVALATGLISHAYGQTYPGQIPAGTIFGNATSGPQPLAPVAADKTIYVSTGGNDSNSGLNPLFPKLTLQAGVNAAASAGVVSVGAGTYTLTTPLLMQPGVHLLCADGAVITQGVATNLATLVNFATNTASGASLERCIVDGNRANNTDNTSDFCVSVGAAADVTIRANIVRNCNGYGILVTTGLRPKIIENEVFNFYYTGIAITTGVASTSSYAYIENNLIGQRGPIGAHAIQVINSDYDSVRGNKIITTASVGGGGTGTTVNTSGTTVTWVSGTNFTNVSAGQFVIVNNGAEFLITTVNSATSLTVSTTLPTLSGTPAVIGAGDLLQIDSSSYAIVANNLVTNGATQGIGLSTTTGGETAQKNLVVGNTVVLSGEFCYGVEQVNSPMQDNSLIGNMANDCGQSFAADGAGLTDVAIGVVGASTFNTFVDGNYIRDDQGTHTITYWMGVSSVVAGQVFVGNNVSVGPLNNGILNDVSSIALSNWGAGAATSNIVSQGNAVIFTITSGTTPGATPQFTINRATAIPQNPPIFKCNMLGGTGVLQFFDLEQNATLGNSGPGSWTAFYNGTPASSGLTYIIICK